MTDAELIQEMFESVKELNKAINDPDISASEMRLTMRITVMLIEKWIEEIPAGE